MISLNTIDLRYTLTQENQPGSCQGALYNWYFEYPNASADFPKAYCGQIRQARPGLGSGFRAIPGGEIRIFANWYLGNWYIDVTTDTGTYGYGIKDVDSRKTVRNSDSVCRNGLGAPSSNNAPVVINIELASGSEINCQIQYTLTIEKLG